jgi:hypothetical protein
MPATLPWGSEASTKSAEDPLKCPLMAGFGCPTRCAVDGEACYDLLSVHFALARSPDHFLPFVPIFDYAGPPVVFKHTLQALFPVTAFGLLSNYRVRMACLVLGGLMLVALLSSRTFLKTTGHIRRACGSLCACRLRA